LWIDASVEGDGYGVVVRSGLVVICGDVPVVHEDLGEGAAGVGRFEELGRGGEGAEFGVVRYLFDLEGCGVGFLLFGEVEGGDLQGVEEQAGTARVEGAGG
jgi:hypothetical protein